MAELLCRTLRDGAMEGEHAPSLTIKDSLEAPLGCHMFNYVLSQLSSLIVAGKSQSKGVILVCYARSASFYLKLLERRVIGGLDMANWIRILDCCTDPLGWKLLLPNEGNGDSQLGSGMVRTVTDVRNIDSLCSLVLESGKGLVGKGNTRFSVAIDSVSEMLRHSSLLKVGGFLTNLRSCDRVSSIFWLVHSDLHDIKCTAALEYMSSMIAGIELIIPFSDGQRENHENSSSVQKIARKRLNVRFKCRNGRVRVVNEEFHVLQSGINFTYVSSEPESLSHLLPKVHFNLQLSDKERLDRANVVLPFEHQGNGSPIQIYDGRRPSSDDSSPNSLIDESIEGKIIYFRDSEDEMPDSDEDPDDDLDI